MELSIRIENNGKLMGTKVNDEHNIVFIDSRPSLPQSDLNKYRMCLLALYRCASNVLPMEFDYIRLKDSAKGKENMVSKSICETSLFGDKDFIVTEVYRDEVKKHTVTKLGVLDSLKNSEENVYPKLWGYGKKNKGGVNIDDFNLNLKSCTIVKTQENKVVILNKETGKVMNVNDVNEEEYSLVLTVIDMLLKGDKKSVYIVDCSGFNSALIDAYIGVVKQIKGVYMYIFNGKKCTQFSAENSNILRVAPIK